MANDAELHAEALGRSLVLHHGSARSIDGVDGCGIFRNVVQAATRVDEVKTIRNKALAMEVYAYQAKDCDLVAVSTDCASGQHATSAN